MADIYFPSNGLGTTGFTDTDDTGAGLNIGFIFSASEPGYSARGVRWYSSDGTTGATAYLFDNDGEILASSASWSNAGGAWYEAFFPEGVSLTPSNGYIPAVVRTNNRVYSYKQSQFPHSGAPFSIESNMGRWAYSDTPFLNDADSNASQSWYGIDVIISDEEPGPTESTFRVGEVSLSGLAVGASELPVVMLGGSQVWPEFIPDPNPPAELPGWLVTEENTGLAGVGVTDEDLTAYSGSLSVTTRLYRQLINLGGSQLELGANGVLEECKVVGNRAGGQGQIRVTGSNAGILNSDVIGTNTSGSETIGIYTDSAGSGLQIVGTKVFGHTIGVWEDGSGGADRLIDRTYVKTLTTGTAHKDGFTRRSGTSRLVVKNSRWDSSGNAVTGAIFFQPTWGEVGNVRFENCMFEGAGYCVTLEAATGLEFVDNRFVSTGYGPVVRENQTSLTWTDNYHWANNPGNNYRGSAVS